MSQRTDLDYQNVVLEFTRALAGRDYDTAYAMTSEEYRRDVSREDMQRAFEEMIPDDWIYGDIEVTPPGLDDWPDKRRGDIGWAYVSIGGDGYSEAVSAVVTRENDSLKLRAIEFGRP